MQYDTIHKMRKTYKTSHMHSIWYCRRTFSGRTV